MRAENKDSPSTRERAFLQKRDDLVNKIQAALLSEKD
jgi:hypothetical protein